MTLRIGIVSVRGAGTHPTRRLLAAIQDRGHVGSVIDPYRIWPLVGSGTLGLLDPIAAPLPDVVLPRQGAEIGPASMAFLQHLQAMGAVFVNAPGAVALARDQFASLRAMAVRQLPVPDTVLINTEAAAPEAAERLGGFPLVVKQPSGRQGRGVWRVDALSELIAAADRHCREGKSLLVQRYLPTGGRRDLRLVVVGRKVLGAVALKPLPGDFRANFHLTGAAVPVTPTPIWRRLALEAAASLGLDVAGVDLMVDPEGRPWLMEVNYAPGFRGFQAATGVDVADAIIAGAEDRCRAAGKSIGAQERRP
jgi:ribosomal protein S6--L-glutamate ligase